MNRKQTRILLADDDLSDWSFLREVINQIDRSIKIDIVANVREIFQYLARCQQTCFPCLIIIDSKMPYLEVLEKMRTDQRVGVIPRIVWTAVYTGEIVARCLQAGAADCLPKASKASELKAIAVRMLRFCRLKSA